MSLELMNNAADFGVIARKEEFQRVCILAEQEAQLQPDPTFKNVLFQPSDRNPGVNVRLAETFGNGLKRRFNTSQVRVAQISERRTETRAEQNDEFRHASVFPRRV